MANYKIIKIATILAIGLPIMFCASLNAFVNATEILNPTIALQVDPDSPAALATLADIKWTEGKKAVNDTVVRNLTTMSLRELALNPRALRQMGLAFDVESKPVLAQELMSLANRLTRRDVGTELWQIESAAAAGDVQRALKHYNFALLTNPDSAKTALFPSLATALDDSEIRSALVPYFRSNPAWLMDFMSYAISPGGKAEPLAQTIIGSAPLHDTNEVKAIQAWLIALLVNQHRFELAKQLFLIPGKRSPELLESAGLTNVADNARYAPIGWKLETGTGVGASVAQDGQTDAMTLYAAPGANGVAAQKLLYLPSGNYSLSYTLNPIDFNTDGNANLTLTCPSTPSNRPLVKNALNKSSVSTRLRTELVVDSACPVQLLTLALAGGNGDGQLNITIHGISISKN
jgi:hypothetical protein